MQKTDAEIVRDAVIDSAVEQIRGLLESNYNKILQAAEESFIGNDAQQEPVAKVTVALQWGALARAPKIVTRIGWSARFADESEAEVDPLQSKLGLEDKP